MEELTSLLVGTRGKFQHTDHVSDLIFLEKFVSTQRSTIIPLLEHDPLARIFSVQRPQTVPLSNTLFHLHLLSVITLLLESPFKNENSKDQIRTASFCVERVLDVAKSYLFFILPKESFLKVDPDDIWNVTRTIRNLNNALTDLEQFEAKLGRLVIKDREGWEVARMTEIEREQTLEARLENMYRRDEDMRKNETEEWELRRRRLGECGFEDALEARMATRGYLENNQRFTMIHAMEKEEGMNFDFFEDDDSEDSDSSDDSSNSSNSSDDSDTSDSSDF
ncbi:hypothetical protein BLNAU_14954 [Blattamonas nauphoetae]|uniref:Uncharacterized protein n=1 Tax=Blattamonas nauphoetae TaxID=2049346 RepID=A0ABQ9XCA9_9EUKA|nr:hypothetical protein BLNAU_14954 [Blattamonas nauphoetae]